VGKSEKTVCTFDAATGVGRQRVDIVADGLVRREDGGGHEAVDVLHGGELQSHIDARLSEVGVHYEMHGDVPCGPPGVDASKTSANTDAVRGLLDRAHDHARSDADRRGIDQVRDALDTYQRGQAAFAPLLDGKLIEIGTAKSRSVKSAKAARARVGPPPPPRLPPTGPIANALGKLKEIGKAITDAVAGVPDASSSPLQGFLERVLDRTSPANRDPGRRAIDAVNPVKAARPSMTPNARTAIVAAATGFLQRDTQYTQSPEGRQGPDSFDCSGFVGFVYAQAGMGYATPGARMPSVSELVAPGSPFARLAAGAAPLPGDLIVHLKSDGNSDEHVGIFAGFAPSGEPFEISAQTKHDKRTGVDAAKIPIGSPGHKPSIGKTEAPAFGTPWRVYRWR
jgi:hypothetical protein